MLFSILVYITLCLQSLNCFDRGRQDWALMFKWFSTELKSMLVNCSWNNTQSGSFWLRIINTFGLSVFVVECQQVLKFKSSLEWKFKCYDTSIIAQYGVFSNSFLCAVQFGMGELKVQFGMGELKVQFGMGKLNIVVQRCRMSKSWICQPRN